MKIVTDDKALSLAIQLLQNDKDIQEQLLENDDNIKSELLDNFDELKQTLTDENNSIKKELDEKATTEEVANFVVESKKYTDSVLTIKEF